VGTAVAAGKAVVAPAGIGSNVDPAKAGPLSTRYAAILKPRSIRRAQSAVNHRQRGTVLVNDWEERLPVANALASSAVCRRDSKTCLLPNCPGSRLAQRTFSKSNAQPPVATRLNFVSRETSGRHDLRSAISLRLN
jgi:hypothetical protein